MKNTLEVSNATKLNIKHKILQETEPVAPSKNKKKGFFSAIAEGQKKVSKKGFLKNWKVK